MEDLNERFDVITGMFMAQKIILTTLLRADPKVAHALHTYLAHVPDDLAGMSPLRLAAMKEAMADIIPPVSELPAWL